MDTKRKEQLQRTLVFLGLGLLFTLSIWFIFRPSADEQSAAEQGLNKDVPQASPDELPTSKLKAYELGCDEEAEGRKSQLLGTLADYFSREGHAFHRPQHAVGRCRSHDDHPARRLPPPPSRGIGRLSEPCTTRGAKKTLVLVPAQRRKQKRPSFWSLRNAGSKKGPRFGPCATQGAKKTLVSGPAQRRKQKRPSMRAYSRLLQSSVCLTSTLRPPLKEYERPKYCSCERLASTKRRSGVSVIQNEKLIQPETSTVGVSFTRDLKAENYTFLSALYERQNLPYEKSNIPLSDALLLAGYMHPLLSDGGKNAFVYAGLSALAGYEELNRGKSVLPDGAELLDRSRLVGGGGLHLTVELFLSDHLLFVVGGRGLFLFGSDVYLFRPAISAGFRINL